MKKIILASVASTTFAVPAIGGDLGQPAPEPWPEPVPAYNAPFVPLSYDWTGFYLGGHFGYGWATTNSTTTNTATGVTFVPVSTNTSAWHGGGQIGFDYMMPSRIVVGVLADVSSGASQSTTTIDAFGTSTNQSQTFVGGTVRGRLGYAIDRVLLYATVGWAWLDDQATRTQLTGKVGNAVAGTVESVNPQDSGWTAGGGIAFAFAPNWNIFAEYRYSNFTNTITFPIAQRSTNSSVDANGLAVGLNYKFDWGQVGCALRVRTC